MRGTKARAPRSMLALASARCQRWLLVAALASATGASAEVDASCSEVADSSRIAVAGGSLTEILYYLGEQARIVAVDSTSNFPQQATEFPSVGYVRALSAEGLLSLEPTLVLGEDDMGPPEVLEMVSAAGVPVVQIGETHTASGIVDKVRCVASVLGVSAESTSRIEALVATETTLARSSPDDAASAPPKAALLLQFRDGAPIGAGGGTSGDGLLRMAGAANALGAFDGWKPVSMEAMSLAQPDYIIITERGVNAAGGAAEVLAHPAVQLVARAWPGDPAERLIVRDGMTMLGFGPRTLGAALELRQRMERDKAP